MLDPITPENQGQQYNEAARYAQEYLETGNRLDLGPSIQKQEDGEFSVAKLETPEDTAKFYEENIHLGIDPNDPNAEQTFKDVTAALNKRHTDYLEMFGEAAGEIAKVPSTLVEGLINDPNPAKAAYSTLEGTARGLRDMWGMFAQSENPNSLLFKFRGAIGAAMRGKPSSNWREDLDQWNEARRFLYHSYKMQNGDETLLEQFKSLNLSDERKEQLRSFVNPEVAHAMAFLGMELPSLIAAPFTGGASAELGVAAAVTSSRAAMLAKNANIIQKIGGRMASATQRFEGMAARASQRLAGNVAYGLGSAIEPVASIAEGLFGGTIESLAGKTGFSEGMVRNAVTTQIVNGGEAIGATGVRQTVGFIGSFGLRTTAETLKELGDVALQRASGAMPISEINGLTVIERLASSKHLSPSAKMVAKTANVLVDPLLQLSTSALQNSYKDALMFGTLGYLNDKEKGMVGGAAMGMVWGGYSGAFRHAWANVTGGNSHALLIKNFDENFLNYVSNTNPEYGTSVRRLLSEVDTLKSSRASANARTVIQNGWLSLSPDDRANLILHIGNKDSLSSVLKSKGLDASQFSETPKGMFHLVKNLNKDKPAVPLLFLNEGSYRPAEIAHESYGHLLSYSLEQKGVLNDFLKQMVGNEKNGGAMGDDSLLVSQAARRMATEIITENSHVISKEFADKGGNPSDMPSFSKYVNENYAKRIYQDQLNLAYRHLDEIRADAKTHGESYWTGSAQISNPDGTTSTVPKHYQLNKDASNFMRKYLFEETIAGYSEALFSHTNMSEMNFSDDKKPLRYAIERFRNELFAKKLTQLELAGIRARRGEMFTESSSRISGAEAGEPTIQAEVYDNGKWLRSPELDGLVRSMVKTAIGEDGQAVAKLSPERQAVEARRYGKEFMFSFSKGGAVMHGTKELNDTFTKNAEKGIQILDALPQEFKPDFITDEHGNRSVDMYKMKDEAYDALVGSGVLDKHSADTAKGFRDTMTRWEASGFSEGNIISARYWGDSHRTIKRGLYERVFGNEVPVTHRVFVPFELKMSLRTTDETGKPLRNSRGGMVATVVDYMAIHRRKMKNWSRADFQKTFISLDNFNSDFDLYLTNMMKDPATRVPTAELFKAKYGDKSAQVRDMLYETFGGRKRLDEGYINSPREGYHSNPEDPNYPIHSMKLEMIVGAERVPARPMPYHHGRSYEGLRRNFSTSGFEVFDAKGTRLRNGQGYEVMTSGSKFKTFDPFGMLIGIFDSAKKAIKAANKHLGKMDEADMLPMGVDPASLPSHVSSPIADPYKSTYGDSIYSDWQGGVRRSTSGLNEKGEIITWTPDFHDDVHELISSGKELKVKDLFKNPESLREFRERSGFFGGFLAEEMLISESPKEGTGIHSINFDTQGSNFAISFKNQNVPTILLDVNRLAKIAGSKTGLNFLIKERVKKAITEMSMRYSPNGDMFGGGIRPMESLSTNALKNYHEQVTAIRRLAFDKKATTEQQTEAVTKLKAAISQKNRPYMDVVTKDSEGNFRLNDNVDAEKINKLLSVGIPKKANFDILKEVVESAIDASLEVENSDFITIPNLDGTERAIPVYNGRKLENKLRRADKAIATALSKQSEFGAQYAAIAKEINHALFQAHSSESMKKNIKGDSILGSFNNKIGGKSENYVISSVYTSGHFTNLAKDGCLLLILEKFDEVGLVTNEGGRVLVDSSLSTKNGNFAGGLMGSSEAKKHWYGPNLSPKMADGTVGIGSHDPVVIAKALNRNMSGTDVMGGSHAYILNLAAIHEMPSREAEIMSAYKKIYDGNGEINHAKVPEYVDEVLRIATEEQKESVIDIGHASAEIAFSNSDAGEKRIKRHAYTNPPIEPYARQYAMDAAKTSFTHALQHYWSIPTKSEGGTVISDALRSLASRKAYAELGVNAELGRIEALSKKISQFHKEGEQINNARRSVGDLSVVRDEDKVKHLKNLGLVKTIKFGGKDLHVFEFSDKNASLNLAKAQGRSHILPFLSEKDPESAYSDYAAAVRRRSSNKGDDFFIPSSYVLGRAKLGDIFRHDELFEYYPEFRNMEVEFRDFHGARHVNYGGTSKIELGVRSFAAAELNLSNEVGGALFNNKKSLHSQWISENPLSSIILHEVQHAIQLKHGWMGTDGVGDMPSQIAAHYFANLLGLKGSYSLRSEIESVMKKPEIAMKAGRFIDPEVLRNSSKDEFELASRLANSVNSPVFQSLEANAKPLIVSASRNFTDFIVSQHEKGLVSDEFAEKAMLINKKAKEVFGVDDAVDVFMEMQGLREEAIKTMPDYSIKMHDNMEWRAAYDALGMVSSIKLIGGSTPIESGVMLRMAIRHYKNMSYILEPVERMARETENRRGMSEAELSANPRKNTEDLTGSSVLSVIRNAMDQSKVSTDLELGSLISAGGVAHAIMKSVGGLGEISEKDSITLTSMGRSVLAEMIVTKAIDAIDDMKRVAVIERGWTVGKDGKMVLKSGRYLLKGATHDEFTARMKNVFGDKLVADDHIRLDSDMLSTEGHTYSIEDIALLSSTVVESERVVTVGNSAIDAVLSPRFPAAITGSEILQKISEIGTATPEGIRMSKLAEIANLFSEVNLTKNDLVNLMAYHHQSISESAVYAGKNSNPMAEGIRPNLKNLTSTDKINLVRSGTPRAKLEFASGTYNNRFAYNSSHQFRMGQFKVKGSKIHFAEGDVPEWIRNLGNDAMEKFYEVRKRLVSKITEGVRMSYIEHEKVGPIVERLNQSLISKMALIGPVIDEAIRLIGEGDGFSDKERVQMAVNLMSDIEKAHYIMTAGDISSSHMPFSETNWHYRRGDALSISHISMNRMNSRLGAGSGQFALGGHRPQMTSDFDTGPQSNKQYQPVLMLNAYMPFVMKGEDAISHGTATSYIGFGPNAVGFGNYADAVDGPELGYAGRSFAHRENSAVDSYHNAIYYMQEGISNNKSKLENVMRDIEHVEAGRSFDDAPHVYSNIADYNKMRNMTPEELAAHKDGIVRKIEAMSREKSIVDKMVDGWAESKLFNSADYLLTENEGPNLMSGDPRSRSSNAGYRPIHGVQAYATDKTAIINIDTFSPAESASDKYTALGLAASSVPPEIRLGYVRHMAYSDMLINMGLLSEVKYSDGTTKYAADRLSPLHKVAKAIASENNAFYSSDNQHLSHLIGGNILTTQSMFSYGVLKSDGGPEHFVSVNGDVLQRLWGENGRLSKAVVTEDSALARNNNVNGADINMSSIGVAAATPLMGLLKNGFMDFWNDNKTLTVEKPRAFLSSEFSELCGIADSAGMSQKELGGISKDLIRKFMDKITQKDIDLLSHELSSIVNSETITDVLSFINSNDLAEAQRANPVNYPHAIPNVDIRDSLSHGLSRNLNHTLAGHAAIQNKAVGIVGDTLKEYRKMIKQAMRTESFWHGFFATIPALKEINVAFPSSRGMDTTVPLYARSAPDGIRAMGRKRFSGVKIARFSKAMGHDVDSLTNNEYPSGNMKSGDRWGLDASGINTSAQEPYGISLSVHGNLWDYLSPSNDDTSFFTAASDNSKFRAYKSYESEQVKDYHGYPIERASGKGSIQKIEIPSVRKDFSDGTRRRILVNQIANMAANMGKSEVSVQAARFPASTRPSYYTFAAATADARSNSGGRNAMEIERQLDGVGQSMSERNFNASDVGRMGFCWQRLPDGRIMVNYTPSIDIPNNSDMSISPVSEKMPLGINYRRSIGWDVNSGGLLIPQAQSRMMGLLGAMNGNYRNGNKAYSELVRIFAKHMAYDKEFIDHSDKAVARVLKYGYHGEAYSEVIKNTKVSKNYDSKRPFAYIKKQLEGNAEFTELGDDAISDRITHQGAVLAQANPEMSYLTFILPKNATIEDMHGAISAMLLSTGKRLGDDGYSNPYSQLTDASHGGRDSYKLGLYAHDVAVSRRNFETLKSSRESADSSSIVTPSDINTFNPNDVVASSSTQGGRQLQQGLATLIRYHTQRNPRWIDQIGRAFSMIQSKDSGYHIPDSERHLSAYGDRAEVIRHMFPDRPDLLQYAWDEQSSINLSVEESITRGGGWLVKHDAIVGLDAAGIPVRKRIIKSFKKKSEAVAHADKLGQSVVAADIPRELFSEGGFRIDKIEGKTNSVAQVHQNLTVNAEPYQSGGESHDANFIENGKYLVGNFQTEFATEAEAKAFSKLVLTPEVISGKSPSRQSIMLSVGGLNSKEMEQQLRREISFATGGSPFQFSSTLMRAISEGLVAKNETNRHGAITKKWVKEDVATGAEWYESLINNMNKVGGSSKMEMRTTGMTQFLYDHKDVKLTRQEIAEFAYAMYPRMGRKAYFANNIGNVPSGKINFPSGIHPEVMASNNIKLYGRYITNQMEQLVRSAAEANEQGRPVLEASLDKIASMHVDAMRSAIDKSYGEGRGAEVIKDHKSLMNLLNGVERDEKITGSVMELFRYAFNDAYSKAEAEQLVSHGGDMRIIDFDTAFSQGIERPEFLRLEQGGSLSNAGFPFTSDFEFSPNSDDYKNWSSGLSGYQMDTLHGNVAPDPKIYSQLTASLMERADKARKDGNEVEAARLIGMRESIGRIQTVRNLLASLVNTGGGHKPSKRGAFQYSHLRYSQGAVMKTSWPSSDLAHVESQLKSEVSDAIPVTFMEELQSDLFQKSTFGPSSDLAKTLPSDFAQAANTSLFGELKRLDALIAPHEVDMDQKTRLSRIPLGDGVRGLGWSIYADKLIKSMWGRMGHVERYMAYHFMKNKGYLDGVVVNDKNIRKVNRELSNKLGVPLEVPEIKFADEVSERLWLKQMSRELNQVAEDSGGSRLFYKAIMQTLGANGETKVPNLGEMDLNQILSNGSVSNTVHAIYKTLHAMIAFDEQFAAKAPEIAKYAVNKTPHGFDFDAAAERIIFNLKPRDGMEMEVERYLGTLREDLRSLLQSGVEGVEHMMDGWDEELSRDWHSLTQEHGALKATEIVRSFEGIYMLPVMLDESSNAVTKGGYMPKAMTLTNAIKADVMYQVKKNPDFVKDIYSGDSDYHKAVQKVLKSITDGVQLSNEDWASVIKEYYEFVELKIADNDFDPSWTNSHNNHSKAYPHTAKTLLGRMLEFQGHKIATSIYKLNGDPQVNEWRAQRQALAEKIGISKEGEEPTWPESIPLAEEGSYRSLSMNFMVMRALQNRKNALTFADARHHRNRYGYNKYFYHSMSLGKGAIGVVHTSQFGEMAHVLPYWVGVAQESKGNADFIGRVLSEGIGSMVNDLGLIEHNGTQATFGKHMAAALKEGTADMGKITDFDSNDLLSKLSAGFDASNLFFGSNKNYGVGDWAKSMRAGKLMGIAELEAAGKELGNDNAGNDWAKRVVKLLDNPTSLMQSVPYARTHGYVANYGQPHWMNKVYYAGLPPAFVAQMSHDLFLRPVVEMKDGKYNILDPKTGKLLIGGIESKEEMYEKSAQLSKFLGGSPIITNFLKQFGKVGGHVLDSYMFTAGELQRPDNRILTPELRDEYKSLLIASGAVPENTHMEHPMMDKVLAHRQTAAFTPSSMSIDNNWANRPAKFGFSATDGWNWNMPFLGAYAHSLGVRNASSNGEVATALTKMSGFTSPMMVFKPKFPTANQTMEMRKMIADGLPLMSVGDLSSRSERIQAGVRAVRHFERPYTTEQERGKDVR